MTEVPARQPSKAEPTFAEKVGAKAVRKIQARSAGNQGVWFGLGAMGVVGWSVVVPTLAGAAIGLWLDKRYPGMHAWTLALLVAGLVLGCSNAWLWVAREDKAMHQEPHQGPPQDPEERQ